MKPKTQTRIMTLSIAIAIALTARAWAQPGAGDHLPARSFQRLGTTKLRHGSRILSLAFSPDGQMLAAGGGNDPVRLWNPKSGELLREINEPWVHSLAFTPSGETLVFAGYQKSVRLWSFKLNKEIGRLEGHKAAIKALAISPDTSSIASGSQDGLIILWEWNTKRKVVDLTGHTDEVTALAFSPDKDGNLLASAGSDRVIHLWNLETNKSILKLDAGCGVHAIAFSTDGKTLYSAGDDYLIRRWDVQTGKQTGAFKGHEGIIVSLIVQGDMLVSGALDKSIRIWDTKSTVQRKSLPQAQGDSDALALSKTGDLLATAGLNNTIRIYETATGKEVTPATGPHAGLTTLALSRDNKRLVSMTADGHVVVWNSQDGKIRRQWDANQPGEALLAFAPDGKTIITASDAVRLWNADTGAEIGPFAIKTGDPVMALACSPDGNTVALGMHSSLIEMWSVKERKSIGSRQYPGTLHALAWSPDGKSLAAAGGAKILIYDPTDSALVKSFDVKEGPSSAFPLVASLAFGPESKTLAAGCFDATIRIYNLTAKNPTDAKEHRLCEGHLSVPYALAFSADGRTLVSGSFDKTARLWEAFSGKQIAVFKGHIGPVMGVAFANNGRSVYSGSVDTTVLQWDVPGLIGQGKLPDINYETADLDNAWLVLASEDTANGHKKMWQCIASAKTAIPYMMKPGKIYFLDPERVKKLFKELDSGTFVVRTAAMSELAGNGRWMEGRYDAAMANPPSLEYKRRVEILKEKLSASNTPSLAQERLRIRRFMLMCEQVGSPEAIAALEQLAARGPEEEIRDEARGSLARLKK
jgi:WD40 repeat protein